MLAFQMHTVEKSVKLGSGRKILPSAVLFQSKEGGSLMEPVPAFLEITQLFSRLSDSMDQSCQFLLVRGV